MADESFRWEGLMMVSKSESHSRHLPSSSESIFIYSKTNRLSPRDCFKLFEFGIEEIILKLHLTTKHWFKQSSLSFLLRPFQVKLKKKKTEKVHSSLKLALLEIKFSVYINFIVINDCERWKIVDDTETGKTWGTLSQQKLRITERDVGDGTYSL
jgi:hypothetical protein